MEHIVSSMAGDRNASLDEDILLYVADTIFQRYTTGSIASALAEYFRRRFGLEAAGFMARGTSGDIIMDVSVADALPELAAQWRERMEQAVAFHANPEGGGTPPGTVVALPLLHEGELQGLLCLSEAVPLHPETALKIAFWLHRHRQLKDMAALDPLTGLHNRRHIEELSSSVLSLCRRNHQSISLAMLDLDHFKTVNDVYGHHRGDQFLAAFAERLLRSTRGSDLSFRLGGDEFMIIMPDTRLEEAVKAARRIRSAAEEIEVCPDEPGVQCRVSVGLVEGTGHEKWQDLQRHADEALYFAKRSGRNNIAAVKPDTGQIELIETPGIPALAAERTVRVSGHSHHGHFLVLDDDEAVRDLMIEVIRRVEGWSAQGCATVDEALAEIRGRPHHYDVVITDLMLTEADGFLFLEKLVRIDPTIARVVVSGFITTESAIRSVRYHVSSVLQKPFQADELRSAAVKALAERRRRQLEDQYQILLERECSMRVRELQKTIEALDQTHWALIEAFSAMVDLREPGTGRHSRRVAQALVTVARSMNLPDAELETLRRAALLHDIGKIAVPDAILLKAGVLTDAERAIVRRHVEYSADMLKNLPFLQSEIPVIRAHHEAYDGSGYPDGLAGEQVPRGARLLALVDAYDAMRMVRVYREPLSRAAATAELERGAGTQFDPELVPHVLRCIPQIEADYDIARAEDSNDPLQAVFQ
jgi:putative two-component system response regulator